MANERAHFGRNLREQITAQGYSVRSFSYVYAEQQQMRPEVARRSINRWISKEGAPESATVRKLATALGVRKKDLTGEDDEEEESVATRLFIQAVRAAVREVVQEELQRVTA